MDDGDESKKIGRRRSSSDPSMLPKPDGFITKVGAGAGANANAGWSSKGGVKFAAMDPLSELVWSPQNGLCLRLADCSFTRKRKLRSPAFGIGLSNMVIPQRSRSNDEAGFHVNFELRTRDISGRTDEAVVNQDCCPSNEMDRPSSGTGGCMEDVNTVVAMPAQLVVEEEVMLECKMENKDDADSKPNETGDGSCRRLLDTPEGVGEKTGTLLTSETLRARNALNRDSDMETGAETHEGVAMVAEKEDGDKMKTADCVNVSCLGKVESMAENDLPSVPGTASKTLELEECRQDKEGFCLPDEADAEEASPPSDSSSRKHQSKGKGKEKEKEKEKALSDGDIDGRTWKDIDDDDDDDDESLGSVESCNSAGLFSRGKKRPNFEQQMIAESKRLKLQIQECPGSSSKIRQDSSFMNWISNMMKGFWKANEEDNPPTPIQALPITDAYDHPNRNADQPFALYCRKEDSEFRNTGFQSFFQSIYCPRRKLQDIDVDPPNEERGTDAAPLSCSGKLPNFQEQFLIMNENHVSSSGDGIDVAVEPNVSSGKVASSQAIQARCSENKNSFNHESCTDREAKGSPSSNTKSKLNEDRRTGPEPGGEEVQTFTNRNGVLGSLWVSRFSSRNSCLQSKDQHWRIPSVDLKLQEANESTSVMVKTRDSQKTVKENGVSATNGYDNSNLMHNLDPIVSSPRIESSEALASLFARRLEAIKHIMPSNLAENVEGSASLTCFYCGKKGHHLRDCSEVTDTELGDLMRNINAQNNGRDNKASSGLCIRCFQLNHWASTCPNAPNHNSRTEENKSRDLEGTVANVPASTSGAKFSFHESVDAPKAIFDAVRMLRLSRTDILKWMNSKTSMLDLEGFFLRLRLGKWEEGLGGTGYYVACITGTVEEQRSKRRSENSISVKVGGTTCLVESQYISNHDFLEEELKAWWRTVGKNGGGVPAGEELSRKIRQRKMLGF